MPHNRVSDDITHVTLYTMNMCNPTLVITNVELVSSLFDTIPIFEGFHDFLYKKENMEV